MEYNDLIQTVSAIVEDPRIHKTGLVLVYALPPKRHLKMNEHLFYKSNPPTTPFKATDIFEVEIGGILVKFIKEGTELDILPKNLEEE